MVVCIKGVTGRGLFNPFGQWDFQVILGKIPANLVVQANQKIDNQTIVDVFPTAKRKIMFTPGIFWACHPTPLLQMQPKLQVC